MSQMLVRFAELLNILNSDILKFADNDTVSTQEVEV